MTISMKTKSPISLMNPTQNPKNSFLRQTIKPLKNSSLLFSPKEITLINSSYSTPKNLI
jgi:hypothetical protein